ncbi:MAG TPA: prolyl oligopeptidase family serine peptidase [Blastocatellia bacterium]|nr:prolyl oligopeptidase family serine peptidase [Blastocatellia bacterium]
MKRACAALILSVLCALSVAEAQQVPFLSELFSRYEEFNRLLTAKLGSGAKLAAIEPLRKRGEEAFKRGNIPGIIELIGQSTAVLEGKQWDDKQQFIASLTLETDRVVIEPNADLHVSLTRIYQTNVDQAYAATPTVTFEVAVAAPASGSSAPGPVQPMLIAHRLPIAVTSSNASRRILLADGAYWVVARIESGGQTIAELKRPLYAISNFSDSVAQMSKTISAIKTSTDPKVRPLAPLTSTPEFQLQRLSQLNKSRSDAEIDPSRELDRIEDALSAIAKGQNPFSRERGELERAYQSPDGKLVPYRIYVPKNYDGATITPLVVMLHGVLGDEGYYFSGLFDPAVIKGEAERRGWILAGVNGRGRFSGYVGLAADDSFEVVKCVTRDYRIDASRIYLTGHSMGGSGTWLIASTKPELFAAIAPVSGGALMKGEALEALLAKTRGLPAMVVHGARDGIAPPQHSRDMVSAAQKSGLEVNHLEIPDADHMSILAATFPAILDFFEKNTKVK